MDFMNFFKERLGDERANEILQESVGKTYEEILDERDELDARWEALRTMIKDSIVALHETAKDPTSAFITTCAGTFGRVLNMMEELEER